MVIHTHRRYRTPPYTSDPQQSRSVGSDRSSQRSSPSGQSHASILTPDTTPPKSPSHRQGRDILPRVRKQDQILDPIPIPQAKVDGGGYGPSADFHISYNSYASLKHPYHRSESPTDMHVITPVSGVSFLDPCSDWNCLTPPPYSLEVPSVPVSHSRSISASAPPSHSLQQPNKPTKDAFMTRYAYPTYRKTPMYMTSTQEGDKSTANGSSTTSGAKIIHGDGQDMGNYPRAPLLPELDFESYVEAPPTTNLLDYLTQPNPSPSLVRRVPNANRLQDTHFWWDIRNIRPWVDFKMETIKAIPGLANLLELDIPKPALPMPQKGNVQPETLSALQDLYTAHYLVKVNASLKVSLGPHHLTVRASKPPQLSRAPQVPEYVASYAEDAETIAPGGPSRGRVVGLVRSYEQWNSGMRTESPTSKITYLRELAHLHRYMREHSCRYGYIITEIELICVRMGSQLSGPPIFGLLELAAPIQLNASGKEDLTAPLALWYLHMLATNSPLPGQCPWKVEIGPPAALTRRHIADRDTWINLKPEGREKRDAKRNRGWIMPEEALSRRERGRPRRWTKKMEKERLEKTSGISIAY